MLSYNVCRDSGSFIKNINQQLQPYIIKTLLKSPDVINNKKINFNIILPDYNFINYVKNFVKNNFEPLIIHLQQAPQINEMFKIPQSIKFNNKSEKYFNRVIKFSTKMSENQYLLNLFEVDNELANKIRFNFYFVGIKFNGNPSKISSKSGKFYGFDFAPLLDKNSYYIDVDRRYLFFKWNKANSIKWKNYLERCAF